MKKKLQSIQNHNKKINQLKEDIATAIENLPDNANITRINTNSFIISRKKLKDLILSPGYYNYKKQHKKIADIIRACDTNKLEPTINEIINTESAGKGHNKIKIHPDVVDQLKVLVN